MLNYRVFLQNKIEEKKSTRSFSYRSLSKKSGFGSPNHVQQVVQGNRNLNENQALLLAQALKMSQADADLFVTLVVAEHGGIVMQKSDAQKKLAMSEFAQSIVPKRGNKTLFVANWYTPLVWTLSPLIDPDKLYEVFKEIVPKVQLNRALTHLINEDFLTKHSSGKLSWNLKTFEFKSAFFNDHLESFYVSCLSAAKSFVKRLPKQSRNLRSTTLAIEQEKYPELVEKVRTFHRELLLWASKQENPDSAVQFSSILAHFPPNDSSGQSESKSDSQK